MPFQEKEAVIRQGITKAQLNQFKSYLHVDYETLAQVLHVSERELYYKRDDEYYCQEISDRIVAIMEIYSHGYDLFKDKDALNKWLCLENDYLDKRKPIQLLQTIAGIFEVRSQLFRAKMGAF